MKWTVDRIAEHFIAMADMDAWSQLGPDALRPMPVEYGEIGRWHWNQLVTFVRERLG